LRMHREGADPQNIEMADVLCDFCRQPWAEKRPMVEGHLGACICGNCLSVAYAACVLHGQHEPLEDREICRLCREHDPDRAHWRSPLMGDAVVCARCLKQAAGALHKDSDNDWRKPGSG